MTENRKTLKGNTYMSMKGTQQGAVSSVLSPANQIDILKGINGQSMDVGGVLSHRQIRYPGGQHVSSHSFGGSGQFGAMVGAKSNGAIG